MSMLVALSAVAGFVDAACYLALSQVFTAHVTGNFAALASAIVSPDAATGLRIAVIAAFAVGAASAVYTARAASCGRADARAHVHRTVIRVESIWLALLLVSHLALRDGLAARYAIALCAGAAMGCQTALSKLPGKTALGTPTTVMTSNFAAWVVALVEWTTPRDEARDNGDRMLRQLSLQLLLFVAGAAAGAVGLHLAGIGVVLVPLVLLMALSMHDRSPPEKQ